MEQQDNTIETIPATLPSPSRTLGSGYSPAEVRRSLWLIMLAWLFGASFSAIVGGAALSSFLTKYLKLDDFSYGIVMSAGQAAVFFLFLGSYVNERTGRVKRNFLIFTTGHRLLWLGVAACALWLPAAPMPVKMWVVAGIIFLSCAAANYGGGAGWIAWMSGIVPQRIAGSFFGTRASLGMISMILTSIGVSYLIDHFTTGGWMYVVVFTVAGIFGAIDILTFIPIREIPRPVEETPPTMVDILTTPWSNPAFRQFVLYISVVWASYTMMGTFQWRCAFADVKEGGLGMSVTVGNLIMFILPVITQAASAPFWGRAIDRFGPKPVLVSCAFNSLLWPLIWLFIRPSLIWTLPIIHLLSGIFWPGNEQILTYMQLKGFPETRRTAYVATFQVTFGLACMIGSALGGMLAIFWKANMHWIPGLPSWVSQYHGVFLTSMVLRVASFVFLLLPLQLPGVAAGVGTVARAVVASGVTSSISAVTRARKRRGR